MIHRGDPPQSEREILNWLFYNSGKFTTLYGEDFQGSLPATRPGGIDMLNERRDCFYDNVEGSAISRSPACAIP